MNVTIERLERALALAAYVVVLDGPKAAPLFDRLERELAAARATQDSVARAHALLESYRGGAIEGRELKSPGGILTQGNETGTGGYRTPGGVKAIADSTSAFSSSDGPSPYLG